MQYLLTEKNKDMLQTELFNDKEIYIFAKELLQVECYIYMTDLERSEMIRDLATVKICADGVFIVEEHERLDIMHGNYPCPSPTDLDFYDTRQIENGHRVLRNVTNNRDVLVPLKYYEALARKVKVISTLPA